MSLTPITGVMNRVKQFIENRGDKRGVFPQRNHKKSRNNRTQEKIGSFK